jgi:HSP20 family protein
MPPRDRFAARSSAGELDRLLSDLYLDAQGGDAARAPVDVYLSDGPPALTVELDVAGVDPDQVEILLHGDVLLVRGERRRPPGGRRVYHHAEIAWGPFERRLRLHVPVDPQGVSASYDAGILSVRLPLAERPAARRVSVEPRRPG